MLGAAARLPRLPLRRPAPGARLPPPPGAGRPQPRPGAPPSALMDDDVRTTVERVHACPTQAVVYVAGGGAQARPPPPRPPAPPTPPNRPSAARAFPPPPSPRQALGWLLSVPGASATLLEALVPYSRASMADCLGGTEPPKFACADTAAAMALAAYRRAARAPAHPTPPPPPRPLRTHTRAHAAAPAAAPVPARH